MGRLGRAGAAALAAGGVAAILAVAGSAAIAPAAGATTTGGCKVVGTWVLGVGVGPIVVDVGATPTDPPVTIPAADAVNWTASSPAPAGPRPTKGLVEIDLPWPLGTYTLESWSGTSDTSERSGTYTYRMTGLFPRGVAFTIVGNHAEPGVRCSSTLKLEIEGGPFDSWLGWIALGGLLLSGVALALAGRSSWERV